MGKNVHSIALLADTLRPHICGTDEEVYNYRERIERFKAVMTAVGRFFECIDKDGRFIFRCSDHRETIELPKLLTDYSRREPKVGVMIHASKQPALHAWTGQVPYASIVKELGGTALAEFLTHGEHRPVWKDGKTYKFVHAAMEIAFDDWNDLQAVFAEEWMPVGMQRELRDGAMTLMAGAITALVSNEHRYEAETLSSVLMTLPDRIPWRADGIGGWTFVTG